MAWSFEIGFVSLHIKNHSFFATETSSSQFFCTLKLHPKFSKGVTQLPLWLPVLEGGVKRKFGTAGSFVGGKKRCISKTLLLIRLNRFLSYFLTVLELCTS